MESPGVVVDTSIIIEHLRKRDKSATLLFRFISDFNLYTPAIVEFELLVGANNLQKQQDVHNILDICTSLPFTSDAAAKAASTFRFLRQANQIVEVRDILIAGTALAYDLPLITRNQKHFSRIPDLKIVPDASLND